MPYLQVPVVRDSGLLLLHLLPISSASRSTCVTVAQFGVGTSRHDFGGDDDGGTDEDDDDDEDDGEDEGDDGSIGSMSPSLGAFPREARGEGGG